MRRMRLQRRIRAQQWAVDDYVSQSYININLLLGVNANLVKLYYVNKTINMGYISIRLYIYILQHILGLRLNYIYSYWGD